MSFRPRPLRDPRRSLAQRLGGVADRARQIATRLGARPYRCWLVWTQWGIGPNGERGDGYERDLARVEILPTPLVKTMDSVSLSLFHAGTVPVGSVSVGEISVKYFTEDNLRGLAIPRLPWTQTPSCDACDLPEVADLWDTSSASVKQPYSFHWEIHEDGRHGDQERKLFRLLNQPMLSADNAEYRLMLERVSPDRLRGGRDGKSPFAPGSGR